MDHGRDSGFRCGFSDLYLSNEDSSPKILVSDNAKMRFCISEDKEKREKLDAFRVVREEPSRLHPCVSHILSLVYYWIRKKTRKKNLERSRERESKVKSMHGCVFVLCNPCLPSHTHRRAKYLAMGSSPRLFPPQWSKRSLITHSEVHHSHLCAVSVLHANEKVRDFSQGVCERGGSHFTRAAAITLCVRGTWRQLSSSASRASIALFSILLRIGSICGTFGKHRMVRPGNNTEQARHFISLDNDATTFVHCRCRPHACAQCLGANRILFCFLVFLSYLLRLNAIASVVSVQCVPSVNQQP